MKHRRTLKVIEVIEGIVVVLAALIGTVFFFGNFIASLLGFGPPVN